MLGVIFHFDYKQSLDTAARRFLFQCYDYTCRAFDVGRVVMVDPVDVYNQTTYASVKTLDQAVDIFDGVKPVYIHETGEVPLEGFRHHVDAVYIVGPDYSVMRVPDGARSVRIDYPNAKIPLWAHVALGMVLLDRSIHAQWDSRSQIS